MATLIFGTKSVIARCLRIYALRAKNQDSHVVLINRVLGVYIGIVTLEFVRASNSWMRAHLIFRASKAFLAENTFLIGIYVSEDTSLSIQC